MRLFDILKRPLVAVVVAGIVGLAIGLLIGWQVWPVEWKDASPAALAQTEQFPYQEDYLRMAIDSYRLNPDPETAWARVQSLGVQNALNLLREIQNNPGKQDMATIMNFYDAVAARASQSQGQTVEPGTGQQNNGETTAKPSLFSNPLFLAGGGILAFAVIVGGVYVFWSRYLRGNQPSSPEDFSPARQAQEINKAAAETKTDFTKLGLQEPISRTMTTYVLGDDLYDESFSIDAPSGEFLGEYGVGVSEAIGVGDPKKVTAVEIWLFDKNDIKTATKVLMSQHAYNDPNIRGKLEAKGELVLLEPHGQVLLETQTLQLLATIVDLEYGQSNLPTKSYFDRITLELAVWPKG